MQSADSRCWASIVKESALDLGTVCECCLYLPGHSDCLVRTGVRTYTVVLPFYLLPLGSESVDLPKHTKGRGGAR